MTGYMEDLPEWKNWANLAEELPQLLVSDFIGDVAHCAEPENNQNKTRAHQVHAHIWIKMSDDLV